MDLPGNRDHRGDFWFWRHRGRIRRHCQGPVLHILGDLCDQFVARAHKSVAPGAGRKIYTAGTIETKRRTMGETTMYNGVRTVADRASEQFSEAAHHMINKAEDLGKKAVDK